MRGYFHNLVLLGLCPVRIVVQDVLLIQKEKIILEMFTGWTIDCEYWKYPVPLNMTQSWKLLFDIYNPTNPRQSFRSICCHLRIFVTHPESDRHWRVSPNHTVSCCQLQERIVTTFQKSLRFIKWEKRTNDEISWDYKEPLKPPCEL